MIVNSTKYRDIIDHVLFSLMNRQPVPCLQKILALPELCPYLEMNGVSGVLFYYLRKTGLQQIAPPDIYESLQEQFHFQVRRNMACTAAAKEVFHLLQSAGITLLVLKGISLAEHVYPHFAMRTTSDLDILINKSDLLRADEVLTHAGYRVQDSTPQQALRNPPGYLASLEYQKEGTAFAYVHLHWHLVNTSTPAIAFIKKVTIERIWEKSVLANVAGSEVRLLCPEHLIIYLCEHALRVGHSFDRLILTCDIFYTVKAYETVIDWDNAAAEAKALGLLHFAYLGLKIVQYYGGQGFLTNDTLNKFSPPSLSGTEQLFLSLQEKHYRMRGSSYLVYLALSKGLLNKGRLILRTIFPPPLILAQRGRIKLPDHAYTLYIKRIHEIMTHLKKIFLYFIA